MATRPDANATTMRGHRLFVVLLIVVALLQIAMFGWAPCGSDWARDLVATPDLRAGDALPLRGPLIADTAHLGPVWFWLLAIPVALGLGFLGTTLFVAALATLKVVLAWRVGFRLGGPRLALAFAATMLLPGWGLLYMVSLTHTVMLQALLLASALPLIALWQGEGRRNWAWFGLWAGLAMQAHPVALLLAVPALAVALRRRAQWRHDLPLLLAGVLLSILPLMPSLVAEVRDGFPVVAALTGAEARERTMSYPSGVYALLQAMTLGSVAPVYEVVPARLHLLLTVGYAALLAAVAAGLGVLWRDPRRRRAWLLTLAGVLLTAVWLVVVRAVAPFYMAMLLWPPLMLALAWPLAALADARRFAGPLHSLGLGAVLGLGGLAAVGEITTMHSGHAELSLASVADVRTPSPAKVTISLLPAWGFDALARRHCDAGTLHVHGELAAVVDFFQGVPFRWTCPETPILLGGRAATGDARRWFGATPTTLRELGLPDDWSTALSLAPLRVIAPESPVPLQLETRYPFRPFSALPTQEHRFDFKAGKDEAVAVHAPLFVFEAATVLSATCNGREVVAAVSGNTGALFLPPADAAGELVWSVVVSTRVRDHIDIVTLPVAAAPR
jgi:hypothetical protein